MKQNENKPQQDVRTTFIIDARTHKKIKALAYWERRTIKDVFNRALSEYLTRYEKKNGTIKPQP